MTDKTPDALHLAVALDTTCAELWTNDKRLASAAEGRIRTLTWDDIADKIQRTQPDSDNRPQD